MFGLLLSIEFRHSPSDFYDVLVAWYLFVGFFILLAWPVYLFMRNSRYLIIKRLYKNILLFPFFYFAPIPIWYILGILGLSFKYDFGVIFCISILIFTWKIVLKKNLL